MALHLDDMGGGDLCSEAQVSLAKRAAGLSIALEAREADWSAGRPVDLAEYSSSVGTLARVLEKVGLKRVAREEPTLQEFIRDFDRRKQEGLD